MRVLVYEFVTGGGWYSHSDASPPESLLGEGRAMRDALVADFAAIDGARVDVFQDARQPGVDLPGVTVHKLESAAAETQALSRLAARADWTVLIAPEFEGHLLARTRAVERAGGRLLGPPSELIKLTADKQHCAEHLSRAGIRVPLGIPLAPGSALPADFSCPAVLKPRNGAGSLGIEWIPAIPAQPRTIITPSRLEAYCPGLPASVACLCGPNQVVPLEPCRQELGPEGDFSYRGGSLPLESTLADRARRLAVRAVKSFSYPLGYIGVDVVLGDNSAGEGDFVIEVNPRLTTSYVGLRAHARVNLAATMIAVAEGREIRLCWNSGDVGDVQFNAAGIRAASLGPR